MTHTNNLEAVVVVIESGVKKYVIAQRARGKSLGGVWEFPGGIRRENEGPEECAYRKIREKFPGVDINLIGSHIKYSYDDGKNLILNVSALSAIHVAGKFTPKGGEYDGVKIVAPEELGKYTFIPEERLLVDKLREAEKYKQFPKTTSR